MWRGELFPTHIVMRKCSPTLKTLSSTLYPLPTVLPSAVPVVVALPDEAEAVEGEHVVDRADVLASAGDQLGKASGGDGFRVGSEFVDEAFENPVDQADVAVIKTDLDVVGGGGADDFGGLLDLYAGKAGGAVEQRVGGDAEAWCDGPAEKLAFAGDDVESGCGAHVDDNSRSAHHVECGDAVDDAVGPDFAGVVGEDRQAGFDARLDEQRLDLEERLADPAQGRIERRNDRRDSDAIDARERLVAHREQVLKLRCDLVGGLFIGCGDAPIGDQRMRFAFGCGPKEPD